MRLAHAVLPVSLVFLAAYLPAQEQGSGKIIAPANGGVEIEEISIDRRAALDAVKEADLTNMKVNLRFSAAWDRREPLLFDHLVRLHSLSPIEDDKGRLLSTDQRMKQIGYLQHEVRGQQWRRDSGDKEGPSIRLLLDAPGRDASTIKAIKGRAEVSLARAIHLEFDDLSAVSGKELSHPDMPELKNLKLLFKIESNDGVVAARLTAPFNYASPWFQGQLREWSVMDGNEKPRLVSKSKSPMNGGVSVEEVYRCPSIEGLSLHLVVLEPFETKTFDFEFRDVKLP